MKKMYNNPAIYVDAIQAESVILGVSSGGNGPIKGAGDSGDATAGGAQVPLRNLWI